MMTGNRKFIHIARLAVLLAIVAAVMALCAGTVVHAQEQGQAKEKAKTVRVGWHEVPYFIKDKDGRRSGYSYEYQCKVAAYTGWNYEYVEGTFPELLQKLMDGEIDVMSDVSFLEERAKKMLYTSLPMGTESYYIFVSPEEKDIRSDDYSTLNGKRVGVSKGTFQKTQFQQWAKARGIKVDLVEMTTTDEESIKMVGKELDAFVTMDVYGDPEIVVPLTKIGSSDFYFAVSKDRPDLQAELDAALNRIQDENKYYNQQLHEKYLSSANTDQFLSEDELKWLEKHDTIRVGYQDNYLAFCATDPATGELTGALKDFLTLASTSMENARLKFETVSYPTAADAMEALAKGEVDCVFPANLTDYDSEELGVVMSPPLMRTEMDAVVRADEQKEFLRKENITVAVNEGNTNYDLFLAEHFPNWKRVYCPDTPAGLEAVAHGEADCVIISNYRYNNISKQCEKLHLTTVYTDVDMDYCFAVTKGNTQLYSILSRVIEAVPETPVHKALTYYSTEDVKTTTVDMIKENLLPLLVVIVVLLLIFVLLLLRSIRAEKKVKEEETLVKALNRQVFVDALTSVRNKGAFNDYIQGLQNKLDEDEEMEFAIGVFDCDNLKKINDQNGHDKGDLYLKEACHLICQVFRHSPVFRIGGDEFAAVLQNEDFQNREELVRTFQEKQKEICATAESEWEEVHVAVGIAVHDPGIDHSVSDTTRRADKIMYENKRIGKSEQ